MLGADLPLIADDVTIEHLLSHTSGIGDYLDEEGDTDLNDYLMPVGVQHLATSEDFVQVLDGFPTKFPAGSVFAYCNGGFAVLAIIAERVAGQPFHELVEQHVCAPAGMTKTAFLRSDELPGDAALGYIDVEACAARTCSTSPCAAPATAGSTRRRPTSPRSGRPVRRRHRAARRRGGDDAGRAASRTRSRSAATGSASGCTRRRTSCSWRAATRASRSAASTTRRAT